MADQELEDYNEENNEPLKESEDSINQIRGSSFKEMMLRTELTKAIQERGFEHPSEIQSQAIPQAILGRDGICQARSGMGKTAVYVLSILQQFDAEDFKNKQSIVAVVLTHTRELAVQAKNEFDSFLKYFEGVKTIAVYGGVNADKEDDNIKQIIKEKPAILIGTPGRVLGISEKIDLSKVKYFVVDECDKIFESKSLKEQMHDIFKSLPKKKQILMLTATLSEATKNECKKYMNENLFEVLIKGAQLTLHGLKQFHVQLSENEKNKKLFSLIKDIIPFNQAIIFTKNPERAKKLSSLLNESGLTTSFTNSHIPTDKRIDIYNKFKKAEIKILISNDLFSRGIDIEKVDLVINYDMTEDPHTYLHRVGRAGRFNTKGLAISFISSEQDGNVLNQIQKEFEVSIPRFEENEYEHEN